MKRSIALLSKAMLVFGVLTGIARAQGSDIQPMLICGLDVYPSPSALPEPEPSPEPQSVISAGADPCLQGETVIGPLRVERTAGQPNELTAEFEIAQSASVCVASASDGKGQPFLYLDAEKIANPSNFNDQIDNQIHELGVGPHELDISLVGKPGGFVDVEVRQIGSGGGGDFPGLPRPGEVQIDPLTGALDMVNADGTVRLQNLATDHPYLSLNGDGQNDSTMFTALTTPLVPLPGKDQGELYFVDWEIEVIDLSTCGTVETELAGSEQINSPTLVTVFWDGTAVGAVLPGGKYGYLFTSAVISGSGTVIGSITSPAFGMVVDNTLPGSDFYEETAPWTFCELQTDPTACRCPGVDGQPGTPDPNCAFSFISELLPELGLPPGFVGNYNDPTLIDKSFITTTQDPVTERYTVTVDLRDYNAGGLVPNGGIAWPNQDFVRLWVEEMTGVPRGTGSSLFNFDYVQIGTSTSLDGNGFAPHTYNHFLLDALTNQAGYIHVGGSLTLLSNLFNDDSAAPAEYQIANPRENDECTTNAGTDGLNTAKAKFCAYNTAAPIAGTDFGVYMLRTTLFDIYYNEETTQDGYCVFGDVGLTCGIRTWRVPADTLEIESSYYVETANDPALTRTETTVVNNAVGVSMAADRGDGEDGVCARAVATRGGLAVRMDSADGAVPDTCIINGIF